MRTSALCLATATVAACSLRSPPDRPISTTEVEVSLLPLSGPASDASMEVSALAWWGEELVLLPQYPGSAGGGCAWLLARAEIEAHAPGRTHAPRCLPWNGGGAEEKIAGFQGFEALVIHGAELWTLVEAAEGHQMVGHLVPGRIGPEGITLAPDRSLRLTPPIQNYNSSFEALTLTPQGLLAAFELNGAELVPSPTALLIPLDLSGARPVPFPSLEYRVTDLGPLDAAGRFTAINYFYPGSRGLAPRVDPLFVKHGYGPTHARAEHVERLIDLTWTGAEVRLADRPPTLLTLDPQVSRNWEGLAPLGDGDWLLATDKFPGTLLGRVKAPPP